MNKVVIMGRFVRDPELKTLRDNVAVCTATVAVQRAGKENKDKADFVPVVFWRHTAEFVARWFAKGRRVAIVGRLSTRSYEKDDGTKVFVMEVIGDEVHFADDVKSEDTEPRREAPKADSNGYIPPSDDDISLPFDLD